MKAKLIILENPIVVTDEEIKEGDKSLLYSENIGCNILTHHEKVIEGYEGKKIISTNKPIDYNGIDFGIVDVEKLANAANGYNYAAKETKAPIFNEGFIEGFKASQQLNEKKFSEDDLVNYRKMYQIELEAQANSFRVQDRNSLKDFEIIRENAHKEAIKQLSIPKAFEVEIEETPTNIKILKKL